MCGKECGVPSWMSALTHTQHSHNHTHKHTYNNHTYKQQWQTNTCTTITQTYKKVRQDKHTQQGDLNTFIYTNNETNTHLTITHTITNIHICLNRQTHNTTYMTLDILT